MAKARGTYKYYFKDGHKIVHGGITNDLERREQEHQQKLPKGHIFQVGRRTTEEAARKWEKDMISERVVKAPPISGSRKKGEYRRAAHAEITRK
ncbi:MAG: hypothetical protein ABIN18_03715 [Pseudomonadota bacterium]